MGKARGYQAYPVDRDPEYPARRVHKIVCDCGAEDTIAAGANSGLPTQVIAKKFGNRNWDVDTRHLGRGVCGACQRAAKAAKRPILTLVAKPTPITDAIKASQEETVTGTNRIPTPVVSPLLKKNLKERAAEAPKAMGIDEMLLVLAAVEDSYDPKTGYKDGYTDAKVAANLNCPVDWVRQVRTKKFGNLPETPEIVEARRAIGKLDEKIQILAQSIALERTALEARIEKFRKSYLDSLQPLEARIQSLREQQKDLTRIVNEAIERMNG